MQPVRLSFVFYDIKSKIISHRHIQLQCLHAIFMWELSRRCRHRRTTSNGYARLWSILFMVKILTRGDAILDQFWTNMTELYQSPVSISELGKSDHNMIGPTVTTNGPYKA